MTTPDSTSIPVHRFREEAMATHFECCIRHEDRSLAQSMASLLFRELEAIEDRLSRFRDGSDIARINAMASGETLLVSETCHACLAQAMELQMITNGVFDIATGGFMQLLRDAQGNRVEASDADWDQARGLRQQGQLQMHPDLARVTCLQAGLQLDLGGIGKGFALEVMAQHLEAMELNDFLLSAGGSTLLARGNGDSAGSGWTTRLSGASEAFQLSLQDQCLSSSGFEVKGAHILRAGSPVETSQWRRVWVLGRHAALVDGLSTACFLMDQVSIVSLIDSLDREIRVWVEPHQGPILELIAS